MTIKKKLTMVTVSTLTLLLALGITIHCGYHFISAKASLANDFDKEAMYLQMMLRGLNEVIINDGTPSSLRTERDGMEGFDAIHNRLVLHVDDHDIQKIMREEIDPQWQGIKKDLKPFFEQYVDLNDEELMKQAGKLIIKTEHIIKHVEKFSETTRSIVNNNSKISGIVIKTIEFILIPLLILAGILSYHLFRTIIHPIGELTAVSEGIVRGDPGMMMDESRKDEFGLLARVFNKATSQLQKATRGLKERSEELLTANTRLQSEITEREKAEKLLNRQLERINLMHSFEKRVSAAFEYDEVLELLIDNFVLNLELDASAVSIMNNQTQSLEYTINKGFRTNALSYTPPKSGQSYAGLAAHKGRIIYISDLNQDPQGFFRTEQFEQEEFISYFAVPLITKSRVKGVLELFHRAHFDAESNWMNFLETISSQAAIALEKAELLNDLQLSKDELLHAYDETIEGWSYALDLRDKETEGHSKRVTDMTVEIAQAFGIKDEKLLYIKRGALLHDIGKMGVPDNILLKPGPLTDEEWQTMKRHPEYAYNMLSRINYLKPAAEIPYYHHEKWDGTGYPRGIKGQEIPLAARIFAVVDVWDALRSDRPYRSAWSKEKTLDHIRSHVGGHFDPEVVEVFVSVVSKADLDQKVAR